MFTLESVSLLVPVQNASTQLAITLERLARGAYQPYQIIIVDDRSSEDITSLVRSFNKHLSITCIRKDSGAGFDAGSARNLAFKQSGGELLVFLDGDCVPEQDFLLRHFEAHNRFTAFDVAVVGPRYDISPKVVSDVMISQLVESTSLSDTRQVRYGLFDPANAFERLGFNDIVVRPCFWSCNMSIKRSSCDRAALFLSAILNQSPENPLPFDNDFAGYWGWEDALLGLALFYTDTVVLTERKAPVYHIGDGVSRYSHRNDALFYRRVELLVRSFQSASAKR